MAIDLSKYDGLNASDAEKRAGSANDEFHPLICEYVSGEECRHVSPDERKRAISAADGEKDGPEAVEEPRIEVAIESAPKEDPAAVENAKSRGKRGQK